MAKRDQHDRKISGKKKIKCAREINMQVCNVSSENQIHKRVNDYICKEIL